MIIQVYGIYIDLCPGVLVAVVGTWSPRLLWSPPGWLSPQAVLLLVVAQTCTARKHFQSPLLQNTPYVALLCLNQKTQTPEDSTYSVMTHLPLSPKSGPLSLGTWHPDNFATFNDLFHDKFQDFSGTALNVVVSLYDIPILFLRDDGEVDGFSARILATLSSWLNFTYSYKIIECMFTSGFTSHYGKHFGNQMSI